MPKLISLTVLFLLAGLSLILGEAPREIQERMRARLPAIDAMKKEQLVGENQKGLLEPLKSLSRERKALVQEENADRKKIYAALASQSDATPEQVALVRARQVVERSAPGVMIQDASGQWVEKR